MTTEMIASRSTTTPPRRNATALGIAMVITGFAVGLPMLAVALLFAMWALADGATGGSLGVVALGVWMALGSGGIFFMIGAMSEWRAWRRARAAAGTARLGNWCFALCATLGVVGLPTMLISISTLVTLLAEPEPLFF